MNVGSTQQFGLDQHAESEGAPLSQHGAAAKALFELPRRVAHCATEGSRHRKIYAILKKFIVRQYTDTRRIAYFVGTALNVSSLAEVNIEEYYLAVDSNLNIGGLCYMYPIGYSWLRIRPPSTSTSFSFYATMPDTYPTRVV
eukprot:5223443-Pleurochrysis_carterae.AAC.1